MTRINLVEPNQLTDKHLMAEYRELPRIFTAVLKLQEQGKTPADVDIPEHYVLGKGHMKFFYNKILWLENRYSLLYHELKQRMFDLDINLYLSVLAKSGNIDAHWYGNYQPYPEDIYLNMIRLCKRTKIASVLKELYHTETPWD